MNAEKYQKIVDDLLNSPQAVLLVNQVSDVLEAEKQKRNQFYNDITDYEKAEFINGEIVIHSPVKKEHNDVTKLILRLLDIYVDKYELGYVGVEKVMVSLTRNDYEPDICYFNNEKAQHFKAGQSLFPAPDLAIEILSKGTAANDRGIKYFDYEAHGVQEYWIVHPTKKTVEQYQLNKKKKYELVLKAKKGEITSIAVKNFKVSIEAFFDKNKNLAAIANL